MIKDNNITENFDNIFKLVKILEGRSNNSEMSREHSSESGSEDFTGTSSFSEALSILYNGSEEIMRKIVAQQANVDFSEFVPRGKIETGVVGYVPHVPNAILGLPNSMIKRDVVPMKNKAIMITTSICGNCNIEASDMERAGVCILNVVNALELSGHRVKLRTSFFDAQSSGENYRTMATVDIKDYSEHLDLRKLSFPIAHPSMFRRIGFKWLETCPDIPDHSGFCSGYGHHCSREVMKSHGMIGENEVYLDYDTIKNNSFDFKRILENEFSVK